MQPGTHTPSQHINGGGAGGGFDRLNGVTDLLGMVIVVPHDLREGNREDLVSGTTEILHHSCGGTRIGATTNRALARVGPRKIGRL